MTVDYTVDYPDVVREYLFITTAGKYLLSDIDIRFCLDSLNSFVSGKLQCPVLRLRGVIVLLFRLCESMSYSSSGSLI